MGRPKFSRKKYETPSHPWQADRIKQENELVKKYGLKNKREIWKAQTRLRKYRGQARELLAKVQTGDVQSKKESNQLLMHLSRMSILPINSTLDDVLALDTECILGRRLQTLTYLKGFSSTPNQARQLVAHGHILVGGRKVTVPGYMITKEEESEIGYTHASPLNDITHPARPKSEFKSMPAKKEITTEKKPEEKKEEVKEDKKPQEEPVKKDDKKEVKEEPIKSEKKEGIKEEVKEDKKPQEEQSVKPEKKEEIKKEPVKKDDKKQQPVKPEKKEEIKKEKKPQEVKKEKNEEEK
jgi:small subunit ribosomal protein S4